MVENIHILKAGHHGRESVPKVNVSKSQPHQDSKTKKKKNKYIVSSK